MKTTKLSKNFAALCLSVAGFWAAQGAFAEVVVPEWQNSFSTAPASTDQFYLYHIDSKKFGANSTAFVDAEGATIWGQQDYLTTIVDGTTYYLRLQTFGSSVNISTEIGGSGLDATNSARKFTFSLNNQNAWSLSLSVKFITTTNYHLRGENSSFSINTGNNKAYEWYLISPAQYANHNAIVTAKSGDFAEANQLLESAEDGAAKTALSNALNIAEVTVNGVDIEDASALTTINAAVAELNNAINAYKQSGLGQYVEALQATLEDAASYDGPEFGFLVSKLSAANTAMNANPQVADDLDDANTELVAALQQARAIVADEAYTTYLGNIATITENIEAASEYTAYANELKGIKDEAETDLLAISSAAGLTNINNNLKKANDSFEDNLNLCDRVWAVAVQASHVGYTKGVDDVKDLKSSDITKNKINTLITNIRSAAKTAAVEYCKTHTEDVDMTIFVNNNSFELGDNTGWTIESNGFSGRGDTVVKDNSAIGDPSTGCDGRYMYNTWDEDGNKGFGISQEIAGLPNGRYRLEALLTSFTENTIYLGVGKSGLYNVPTIVSESGVTSPNGHTEFVPASCEFNVTNGTATIGASANGKWFRADNFRLALVSKAIEFNEKDTDYAYEADEIPLVVVHRTIPNNQWTTLCLPVECDKPAGLTLYEVSNETMDGEHVSIAVTASADNKIKAGKPYIVKNSKNTVLRNYDIDYFAVNNATLADEPQTVGEYVPFTGLFSATDLNAGDIYVSTSTDASAAVPVYKELSADASNTKMNGFRAYFKVTDGASSNVRFITDEVITSIMQAIEDQQVANGTYDLSGRKAATLQKGTYVIDGKKVIIK